MTDELLDLLTEEIPVKRQCNVEGWPAPVWVWRLTTEQVIELADLPHETTQDYAAYGMRLCQMAVGSEDAPGTFGSDRGKAWLARQGNAVLELARAVREFNELGGPSEERRKKSEGSEPTSPSAEPPESSTREDCLSD